MTRARTTGRTAAVALLAGAGLLPASAAAATWHAGLPVAPDRIGLGPPVAALGGHGQAVGAWTVPAERGRGAMRVEVHERRGPLAPWRRATRSGAIPAGSGALAAATSPAGAAAVAWRASGGAVRVAARAGGRGAWRIAAVPGGPPAAGPTAFASPALAVRDDGSADLLWAAREGDGWTVRAAVRAGAAGRWVAAPALAPGPSAGQPRAAVAPDGGAAAAWTDAGAVVLAVRGPDGRWTAAQPLGPGAAPAVAVAAGGVVRVAWSAPSGGADIVRVGGAGTGTGSVGAAEDLAAGTGPQIAATTGASAVAWAPPGGGLAALVRDAAAPATPLARQGDVPAAMVAIGGPGRAVVTWVDREGPGSATAGMATAVPGGPWRVAVQPVGEDVEAPSAAVGPGGDVLVLTASVGRSGTGRTVLAASFDAVARPRLTGSVTGRRLGGRRVAWTVRVRNASRVPAAGVRLRIVAPSATRILPPLPPGAVRRGRAVEVRVGALGPRRARAVRLVVLPGPRATAAAPSAEARAVAVAPVALRPSAPAGLAP